MTVKCLLPPASGGVPDWNPKEEASRRVFKLPDQFRELFSVRRPLSEDIGEAMAKWAAGGAAPARDASKAFTELASTVANCDDDAELIALWPKILDAKKANRVSPDEYGTLRDAFKNRRDAVASMNSDAAAPQRRPNTSRS